MYFTKNVPIFILISLHELDDLLIIYNKIDLNNTYVNVQVFHHDYVWYSSVKM